MSLSEHGAPQGPSALHLMGYLGRAAGQRRLRVVAASTIAGLSRGLLLATFNAAAAIAAAGRIDWRHVAVFALALSVFLLSSYDAAHQGERVTKTLIQRLRLNLCEKLLFSRLRFIEQKGPSQIYAHVSSDIHYLAHSAMNYIGNVQAAVVLAFALVYLAWLSIPGLFAAVLAIAAGVSVYRWQDRRATEMLRRARKEEDEFFEGVYDLVQGFKELKANRARHADLAERLQNISVAFRDLSIAGGTKHHVSLITSQGFLFGLIAVLVFVLPPLFPTAPVNVFQFLATLLFIMAPIEQILSSAGAISRARIALGKIEALEADLDAAGADASPGGRDIAPLPFRTIALKDVHFGFETPGGEDSFDLGPVDLELRRGEALFICGGNGAGKTTLLKLLTGLYEPQSGAVLVDGRAITPGETQRYRELFATIFGDFYLFRRLYGIADPDPEYLGALLGQMQIGHKTRLKDGVFSTVDLSSGQRKRLAYAVNRLSDRQIYVFDEFAADQDPGFRRYFYSAILPELKRQGKTVVAVTHDDRWFAAGDRLIKLEYGRIVEESLTPEAV